jgi:ATP12 chaperone protein
MNTASAERIKVRRVIVPRSAHMVVLLLDSISSPQVAARVRAEWDAAWAQPRPRDYPLLALVDKGIDIDLVTASGADAMDEPLLQFFAYDHLPEHLREASAPFGQLANHIVETLPRNPERTVALRKLLEAKDCAVRARLWKGD